MVYASCNKRRERKKYGKIITKNPLYYIVFLTLFLESTEKSTSTNNSRIFIIIMTILYNIFLSNADKNRRCFLEIN